MDWDNLRIFLAVARYGQILSAARQLRLDGATVGRRLTRLESQLGCRLFERSPLGCTLTPSGEELLKAAQRVESEMARIESTLIDADRAMSGKIRIGAADGIGTYFLAPQLGELARQFPNLTVQLVPLPQAFSVSKREVDIAIALDRPEDGRLLCQKVIDYRLHLYASQEYLARMPVFRCFEDRADHVLVSAVADVAGSRIDFLGEYESCWRSRYECANLAGQVEAVRAGVGVAVLPCYVANLFPGLKKVIPDVTFDRTYWMISHPDAQDLERQKIVRRKIVEITRRHYKAFAGLSSVAGWVDKALLLAPAPNGHLAPAARGIMNAN